MKAEKENNDEEIESKFKDKKKGKNIRKSKRKKEIAGIIFLAIIDHFSKYGWIYCIPDKIMDTVFLKFKQEMLNLCLPRFCILIMELNLRIS